jgi:replicative DNA helicase
VQLAHSFYTNSILSHNSHFLIEIGANALRNKKNVLHYSLEMRENSVGIRYDSNLCDIPSNDVIDRKSEVAQYFEKNKHSLGGLFIKEFPTKTATVYTLKSHIERLKTKGFIPDVIIVDYADIMRSTKKYDALRHELMLIYEELRALAHELGLPIWTASQSNKEGANSDIIDTTNMGEAFGKAATCDLVVSISRKSSEKSTGLAKFFIAKNRVGRDGLVFSIKMDTSKSKFQFFDNEDGEYTPPTKNEKDDDIKAALRQKWKELKNENIFATQKTESE